MLLNDAAWMLYDTRAARAIVKPLHMKIALTLAHTLNVADLTTPAKTFGDER